jgi:hypothetical protein
MWTTALAPQAKAGDSQPQGRGREGGEDQGDAGGQHQPGDEGPAFHGVAQRNKKQHAERGADLGGGSDEAGLGGSEIKFPGYIH